MSSVVGVFRIETSNTNTVFLDNFTLLRYKQPSPPSPTQRNPSKQGQCSQTNSKKEQIKEAYEGFQIGHDVEAIGAAECRIM